MSKKDPTFLQKTLILLKRAREKGITQLEIYKATDLQPAWQSNLTSGRIKNPTVGNIQKLHDYLTEVLQ